MRTLRVAMASAIVLVGGQSLQGQASSDEAALRRLIAAHEKSSIEAYYRQQLASASARSGRHHTHPPEAIRIRFVTADVALVDLPSRSVGGVNAEGQPLAPSELMLITVWRKGPGGWLVVSQRALPAAATPR